MSKLSWTQPVCVACWNADNPARQVDRNQLIAAAADLERCCKCDTTTYVGIYIWIDPASVAVVAYRPVFVREVLACPPALLLIVVSVIWVWQREAGAAMSTLVLSYLVVIERRKDKNT